MVVKAGLSDALLPSDRPTSKWISDAQGSDAGIKMALLLFVGVTVEFDFVKYILYMNLIRKAIFAQINRATALACRKAHQSCQ